MIQNFSIKAETQLEKLAKQILDAGLFRIFAFSGDLGAGKTTFIKAFCRILGSADNIQSPSFSIVNEYLTPSGDPVYHMDFYRIKKIDEVFDLGYEDYFFSGHYCFIEWPEMIKDLLPPDTVTIRIENLGGENRNIKVSFPDL
ncbi:MAG: tRNA (adenosine(37)-N6)-threonylcarbamoyltransferase complex ATPase subunit type 1 TsaE [Chlorobi bacterium]|nr:tRNA (adenosine(37)-N6)-threonylcarbamoyltransferase complex ATPase subunit type 1 TsaE [Chlorobiota bacterium]